jgi:hypothetical protein
VRADGSATWQRHEGRQAGFFPLHDLTHFAVETTLPCRQGFYGLLADGWSIDETGGKGARGPLPPEALAVEHLVGLLDAERAAARAGAPASTAAEFGGHLSTAGAVGGCVATLTDDGLARIRARWQDLAARWAATASGATLELHFDRAATA